MTINILGADYSVIIGRDGLPEDIDGICDETIHTIRADDYSANRDAPDSKKNLDVQAKKVLRHEIVHAFLFESGLAENSNWAQNEELVDWIAIQGPKLIKAWKEAGAL